MSTDFWNEDGFNLTAEIRVFEGAVREVRVIRENAEKMAHGQADKCLPTLRETQLSRLMSLLTIRVYRDVLLRRAEGIEAEVVGYILQEYMREGMRAILSPEDYATIGQEALEMLEAQDEKDATESQGSVDHATAKEGTATPMEPYGAKIIRLFQDFQMDGANRRHDFNEVLKDLQMEQNELR